ncbi:MAG: hypothetical protein M1480_11185 [Bacteroidetes bacterium]|nr:hypothetical protein [Bacteroidota bacterium]
MLKTIFIYERQQSGLIPKLLENIFASDKKFICTGTEAIDIIKNENPKLLFFDFDKSLAGESDILSFLNKYYVDIILNISIINISPSNITFYKTIHLKISNFFKKHFGPRDKNGGIKEAFVRR